MATGFMIKRNSNEIIENVQNSQITTEFVVKKIGNYDVLTNYINVKA